MDRDDGFTVGTFRFKESSSMSNQFAQSNVVRGIVNITQVLLFVSIFIYFFIKRLVLLLLLLVVLLLLLLLLLLLHTQQADRVAMNGLAVHKVLFCLPVQLQPAAFLLHYII